jgi:hypothetical protein
MKYILGSMLLVSFSARAQIDFEKAYKVLEGKNLLTITDYTNTGGWDDSFEDDLTRKDFSYYQRASVRDKYDLHFMMGTYTNYRSGMVSTTDYGFIVLEDKVKNETRACRMSAYEGGFRFVAWKGYFATFHLSYAGASYGAQRIGAVNVQTGKLYVSKEFKDKHPNYDKFDYTALTLPLIANNGDEHGPVSEPSTLVLLPVEWGETDKP